MKNVTVSLPDETAHWVRIWAAHQGKSVSAALAALLEEIRLDQENRRRAQQEFLAVPPRDLNKSTEPYPSRASIHER